MTKQKKFHRILLFLPRILSVLYLCFLSLFAFDTPIFSLGFLIHLIPSFVIAVAIYIGWRSSSAGGVLFLILAGLSVWLFHTYKDSATFFLISAPLFVISMLFYGALFYQTTVSTKQKK